MIVKVYSVFDSKSKAYMLPQFYHTAGVAERAFTMAVNSDDTQFNKTPEDFTLFELGSFDDSNGKFECHSTPVSLVQAIMVKKTSEIGV